MTVLWVQFQLKANLFFAESFLNLSKSVLYKNVRNVRFVLFRKKSPVSYTFTRQYQSKIIFDIQLSNRYDRSRFCNNGFARTTRNYTKAVSHTNFLLTMRFPSQLISLHKGRSDDINIMLIPRNYMSIKLQLKRLYWVLAYIKFSYNGQPATMNNYFLAEIYCSQKSSVIRTSTAHDERTFCIYVIARP